MFFTQKMHVMRSPSKKSTRSAGRVFMICEISSFAAISRAGLGGLVPEP